MNIDVLGCKDCPFCKENDMFAGYNCRVMDNDEIIKQDKMFDPITPDWCPLKKDVIKVSNPLHR